MAYTFELGRIDITLEKLVSGAVLPAAGATLDIYRKSALVSAGPVVISSGGGTGVVNVYSAAGLGVGDTVFINTVTATLLTVTVISGIAITLQNNTLAAVTVNAQDRLVPSNRRPTGFRDERGTVSLGSTITPTDSFGYLGFYLLERSVDILATGGGLSSTKHMPDQSAIGGGYVINPFDFGIKFDGVTNDRDRWNDLIYFLATQAGNAIVECPPGTTVALTKIAHIAPGVSIRGAAGPSATIFKSSHATDPFFEFNAPDCVMERITYDKTGALSGLAANILGTASRFVARDIRLKDSGAGIKTAGPDALLENLYVIGSGHSQILLVTADGGTSSRNLQVRGLRGLHTIPAGQMAAAIVVEKGAKNTSLDGLALEPSDPATQGGPVLVVQAGGGSSPEDVIVSPCRIGSGYGSACVVILDGSVVMTGANAVDSNTGWLIGSCKEAVMNSCKALGSRQQAASVLAGTGIVRFQEFTASDSSQVGAGTFDHILVGAGREDVFFDGVNLGNSIRLSTVGARDGIRYSGGTITRGSRRRVQWAPSADSGILGQLVNPNGTTFSDSFDDSHSDDPPGIAFLGTKAKTPQHVAAARRVKTIAAGTTLTLVSCETLMLNHPGITTFTSVTGATEGQQVRVYNKSAFAMTINHVGGTIENIGAAAVVLAAKEKVDYEFMDGILRQVAAKYGAS